MNHELSRAVTVWTGWGRATSPLREDDVLIAEFGEGSAVGLLPQVRALEEDFYRSNANHTAPDLVTMGEQAAAEFRSVHPEVAEDAVQALAWCYTYDFK